MRNSRVIGLGIVVLAISVYTVVIQNFDCHTTSTVVTTITAIIGAYAIWIQLKRDANVKQAEFIMNYNSSFLANPELVDIERRLETYRKSNELEFVEEDRQALTNYLVYHEALAAMVFRGVVTIEVIDDLFSYRFFLGINNPVVQDFELCPDAEYYRGCMKLYKKWYRYKKKKKMHVMMESTSLHTRFKDFEKYCS